MIRVLVVDDSRTFRKALCLIFSRSPDVSVVGEASSAEEAIGLLHDLSPDVVTLDIEMPGMGGLMLAERIRREFSARILVVSGQTHLGSRTAVEALLKGAHDILEKPGNLENNPLFRAALIRKVHELSEMNGTFSVCREPATPFSGMRSRDFPSLLVVGGSTGGPAALSVLLDRLSGAPLPPVVIVQHMPPAILPHLAERLEQQFGIEVRMAYQGENLLPGTVRLAPGGLHLRLEKKEEGIFSVRLEEDQGVSPHVPSIDLMFDSASRIAGEKAIGVLLSGLGDDGARGLLSIRKAGGETLVQAPETAAAPGMPSAAIGMKAVRHILPPASIGMTLAGWFRERSSGLSGKPFCP